MGVLNSWQRITRVMPGKPHGDGADGDATISSNPNIRSSITGTAGSPNGTAGNTSFANGDLVMLIQNSGVGAGQHEINMVLSGGGTTSLVFKEDLHYSYVAGAQIVKIPRYDNVTINNFTVTNYDGVTKIGGVCYILAKTSITGGTTQTLTAKGGDSTGVGGTNSSAGGVGAGFTGGEAVRSGSAQKQGDGTAGAGTNSASANGNGGGGGTNGSNGGGGGHANTGLNNGGADGTGGSAVGTADLTNMNLGGGGGGGGSNNTSGTERSGGGAGGGIVVLNSKTVDVSAMTAITVNGGGAGVSGGGFWQGGGGAGGSVLVFCQTATLGTNKITAVGGNQGGGGGSNAKNGSDGRIAVHHSGTVTGTTNPTFTDVSDPSIKPKRGGAFGLFV